jgi:predicted nucleic acid-binding protein
VIHPFLTIGPRPAQAALAFDNDVLTDWRAQKPSTVQSVNDYIAVTKVPPALPTFTIFEMMRGFEKAIILAGGMTERLNLDIENARLLTQDWPVLDFNRTAAQIAAYVYPRLSNAERNTHGGDLIIAATALAHDHGIITRNRTDFELIAKNMPPYCASLRIEIWK